MIVRISHVGHIVNNLEEAIKAYSDTFGLRPVYSLNLPDQGIRNAMLPMGNNFIELIEPTRTDSHIARSLQRRGAGLYHVCLVVDNIEGEVNSLKARGARINEIEPTSDLPFKTAWVHAQSTGGVFFELITEEVLRYLAAQGRS